MTVHLSPFQSFSNLDELPNRVVLFSHLMSQDTTHFSLTNHEVGQLVAQGTFCVFCMIYSKLFAYDRLHCRGNVLNYNSIFRSREKLHYYIGFI